MIIYVRFVNILVYNFRLLISFLPNFRNIMCDTLIYGYVKFGDSRVDLCNVIYIYVYSKKHTFQNCLAFYPQRGTGQAHTHWSVGQSPLIGGYLHIR